MELAVAKEKRSEPVILIIDEDRNDFDFISGALLFDSFHIIAENSAVKAVSTVFSKKPDLILISSYIAGMTGIELIRKMKMHPGIKEIPVILLSSNNNPDDITDSFKAGCADYISKPFIKEELLARVRGQLELLKTKATLKNQLDEAFRMQQNLTRQSQELIFLNEQLEVQTKELEELNAQKNKLFSTVSHDLRDPISGLKSLIDTLYTYYDKLSNYERKRKINLLGKEAEFTFRFLDNLLMWSQSQLGELKPLIAPETAANLVHSAILPALTFADEKEIVITADICEDVVVDCDFKMIKTVLSHLISNALRFTPPGGKIGISADRVGDNLVIKVKDTGRGIPNDDIPKLFRPGERQPTKDTENEKGSGLGLLICYEMLAKHGRTLDCRSEIDKGSEFIFSLPINIEKK